jgi:hypothetical protein
VPQPTTVSRAPEEEVMETKSLASCLVLVILLGLNFGPEYGEGMFLRNIRMFQNFAALQPRKLKSSRYLFLYISNFGYRTTNMLQALLHSHNHFHLQSNEICVIRHGKNKDNSEAQYFIYA